MPDDAALRAAGEDLHDWLRLVPHPDEFQSLREYAYTLAGKLLDNGWTFREPTDD